MKSLPFGISRRGMTRKEKSLITQGAAIMSQGMTPFKREEGSIQRGQGMTTTARSWIFMNLKKRREDGNPPALRKCCTQIHFLLRLIFLDDLDHLGKLF